MGRGFHVMSEFPPDAIVVRFGLNTPFWHFSMSYGIFACPSIRKMFHSPDQFVAYKMLARAEDRSRVMKAPNGYIAYTNLQDILAKSSSFEGNRVVVENWDEVKLSVMEEALALKFSQSAVLAEALLRTGDRPIFDMSRLEETFWCHADGRGQDAHGKLLMKTRARLASGELLPHVVRPSK
jgi:hypothetical protein